MSMSDSGFILFIELLYWEKRIDCMLEGNNEDQEEPKLSMHYFRGRWCWVAAWIYMNF